MTDFTSLIDLASEHAGGAVVAANDDFFAEKENLIKASRPVFVEDRYTDRGKWMDGWETRRRREPGYDWAVIRLGLPGVVHGVVVDTAHFTGNFPESCSLDASEDGARWFEILPRTPLNGNTAHRFPVSGHGRVTHVRLNIFPDGGVARLRVYGRGLPDPGRARDGREPIDLAAAAHGGLAIATSDMYFGSAQHMIMPGESRGMHDGWETKRRRGPGHDWAIVELGEPGAITRLVVDTTHFKGNAPGSCSVQACDLAAGALPADDAWQMLLPQTALRPHHRHEFDVTAPMPRASHVRLNIYPDGGISRFRVFGVPAGEPGR